MSQRVSNRRYHVLLLRLLSSAGPIQHSQSLRIFNRRLFFVFKCISMVGNGWTSMNYGGVQVRCPVLHVLLAVPQVTPLALNSPLHRCPISELRHYRLFLDPHFRALLYSSFTSLQDERLQLFEPRMVGKSFIEYPPSTPYAADHKLMWAPLSFVLASACRQFFCQTLVSESHDLNLKSCEFLGL